MKIQACPESSHHENHKSPKQVRKDASYHCNLNFQNAISVNKSF